MYEVQHVSYPVNNKEYDIHIYYDEDAPNPREGGDYLGSFVMWHKNYDFSDVGQKDKFRTPDDFKDFLKDNKCIVMPVYMLDHSGQTISVYEFSDKWDSGQIGYIYVTFEKIKEEYNLKVVNYKRIKSIKMILTNEIAELDTWVRGDIFGYVIINSKGEQVDSCWGFYSQRECLEEATGACDAI